jgi:hypothetical protein
MDRVSGKGLNHLRGAGGGQLVLGPLIWIGILLGSWLMIADWRMLPDLVNAGMAALP